MLDIKTTMLVNFFLKNLNKPNELIISLVNSLFFSLYLSKPNDLSKLTYKLTFNPIYNTVSDFYSFPKSFFLKYKGSFSKNLLVLPKAYKLFSSSLPKIKNKSNLDFTKTPMFNFKKSLLNDTNIKNRFKTLFNFNQKNSDINLNPSNSPKAPYLNSKVSKTLSPSSKKGTSLVKSLSIYNIFDINYIKRERLYTKLKYSRSPAYDIVSGGAAAFFAAFIGFLISEKFGIELVDSGDFYIAFMYGVFIALAFKPFMRILQTSQTLLKSFLNKLKQVVIFFVYLPKFIILFL
jgi:hypothetical protein